MRRRHFETLRPICPSCQLEQLGEWSLEIGWVAREEGDVILEGALHCGNAACRAEYPIIGGLPILVPQARSYLADNLFALTLRDDLDPRIEALLGECSGPGSAYDAMRLHVSSYAWDHYGDLDPDHAARSGTGEPPAGSVVRAWEQIASISPGAGPGPWLDLGCSVGRIAFEMARATDDLVLGIDLSVPMLRMAQRVLHSNRVRYPRRKAGLLYEQRDFETSFRDRERIDFWIADGVALPFPAATFGRIAGLNVIDSVVSPLDLLRSMERTLRPDGDLLLATPYDWSGSVTPPEAWIGGHSPRAPGEGAGARILRALLTPGEHPAALTEMQVVGDRDDIPWTVRMHERSYSQYRLHALAARRVASTDR